MGLYVADELMSNGDEFSIYLQDSFRFVEHNFFGEAYGYWAVSLSKGLGKMNRIVMWTDSINSMFHFHNDDGPHIESMMYYYVQRSENGENVVLYRDGEGSALRIYDAYFHDSTGMLISDYHSKSGNSGGIAIPEKTKSISINGYDLYCSSGLCKNYCADSGNVVFASMHNSKDLFRCWIENNNTLLYVIKTMTII